MPFMIAHDAASNASVRLQKFGMWSAALCFALALMAGCSQKNDSDANAALHDKQDVAQSHDAHDHLAVADQGRHHQASATEEPELAVPPARPYDESIPEVADATAAASTNANLSESEQALKDQLVGYWVVDVDETLKHVPEEQAKKLEEAFRYIQTGMSFDTMDNVSLDVVHQGDGQTQKGQYVVIQADEHKGKIEFRLADPVYAQQGIRVFANIEFPSEDVLQYQAYTEHGGQVVQEENVAVMKRVRASQYKERFETK